MQRPYQSNILDMFTGAVRNIDNDHAYIHEGKLFYSSYKVTLTAGSSSYIALTTPNTDKVIHYRPVSITTSADKLTFLLYEAGTFTGGSDLIAINRNRKINVVAGTTVKTAVTSTLDGTLLYTGFIGGGTGTGQSRSGADMGESKEWVLKKNTVYLIKLTNGSSSSNEICLGLGWYEEDA